MTLSRNAQVALSVLASAVLVAGAVAYVASDDGGGEGPVDAVVAEPGGEGSTGATGTGGTTTATASPAPGSTGTTSGTAGRPGTPGTPGTPGRPGTPGAVGGAGTTATSTSQGVRLVLTVDRRAVASGDVVSAVTTVTNTRSTPVTYVRSCFTATTVRSQILENGPVGRRWTGPAGQFKQLALVGDLVQGSAFSPLSSFERTSRCTADPVFAALAPGRSIRDEHRWRATTAFGTAYDGEAPVRARFGFSLGAVGDPTGDRPLTDVEARTPLRLTGGVPDGITPSAAVDLALARPRFLAFVSDGDPARWLPPHERIDEGARITQTRVDGVPAFEVRLTRTTAGGSEPALVLLARRDGRVLGEQYPKGS